MEEEGKKGYHVWLKALGLAFLLWGCALTLNAASPTGFFILESVEAGASSFLGLICVALGIACLVASRLKRAGLATLVASIPSSTDHHLAHNASNYHRLVNSYRAEDSFTTQQKERDLRMREFEHRYGSPSSPSNQEAITLYHAFPQHRGFKRDPTHIIDEKKVKGGGFFMTADRHAAEEELPGYAPGEISTLKFKIPQRVCKDLELDTQTSNITTSAVYKLPKKKIDLFNDLCAAGYIQAA